MKKKWFRHRLQFCVFSGLVIGWSSKFRATPPYPTQILGTLKIYTQHQLVLTLNIYLYIHFIIVHLYILLFSEMMHFSVFFFQNQHKEKNIVQYVLEVLKYRGDLKTYEDIESWPIPKFPISGKDLIAAGIRKDKKFGQVLNKCKEMWMESDFKMTKGELVEKLHNIANMR